MLWWKEAACCSRLTRVDLLVASNMLNVSWNQLFSCLRTTLNNSALCILTWQMTVHLFVDFGICRDNPATNQFCYSSLPQSSIWLHFVLSFKLSSSSPSNPFKLYLNSLLSPMQVSLCQVVGFGLLKLFSLSNCLILAVVKVSEYSRLFTNRSTLGLWNK